MWSYWRGGRVHPGQVRRARRLAHAQSRSQARGEVATRRSEGRMSRCRLPGAELVRPGHNRRVEEHPRAGRNGQSPPTRGAGTDWGKWADFVSDAAMWTVLARWVVHPGQVRRARRLAHAQSRSQGRGEIAAQRCEGRMSRVSAAGSRTCPFRPRPARRGASGRGPERTKSAHKGGRNGLSQSGRTLSRMPRCGRYWGGGWCIRDKFGVRGGWLTRSRGARGGARLRRGAPRVGCRGCRLPGAELVRPGHDRPVEAHPGAGRNGQSPPTRGAGTDWDKFGMRRGWLTRSRGARGGARLQRSAARVGCRGCRLPGAELVRPGHDRPVEERPRAGRNGQSPPTRGAGTDRGKWADFVSDAAMWTVLARRVVHPGQVRRARRLLTRSRGARGGARLRRGAPRVGCRGVGCLEPNLSVPATTGQSRSIRAAGRNGQSPPTRGAGTDWDKFGVRRGWLTRSRGARRRARLRRGAPRVGCRGCRLPGAELVRPGHDRRVEEHPRARAGTDKVRPQGGPERTGTSSASAEVGSRAVEEPGGGARLRRGAPRVGCRGCRLPGAELVRSGHDRPVEEHPRAGRNGQSPPTRGAGTTCPSVFAGRGVGKSLLPSLFSSGGSLWTPGIGFGRSMITWKRVS